MTRVALSHGHCVLEDVERRREAISPRPQESTGESRPVSTASRTLRSLARSLSAKTPLRPHSRTAALATRRLICSAPLVRDSQRQQESRGRECCSAQCEILTSRNAFRAEKQTMGFASRARLLLLLVACLHATAPSPATAHPADGAAEKDGGAGSLPKTRLSMQGAVEVGQCLVAAADAGCGAFACLENTTCDGPGLQALCAELVRHADMYDVQGKSFIKEALKCMAQGLRGRFNCNQRKCSALSELSLQLQRECYHRHELCAAARPNAEAMALSVPPPTALPKGPYLELLRALFSCDNATSAAVRRALSARLGKAHASALAQMLGGSAPRRQHPGKPAPGEASEGGREGAKEGGKEGSRDGGREGGKEGGKDGGRRGASGAHHPKSGKSSQ
ncbi:unnamed protein product [Lampetra planeri]